MFTKPGKVFTTRPEILSSDHFTTQTCTVSEDIAAEIDGRLVVQAGTVFPANDATAIGIIITDVDVTDGDAPAAYIDHGSVYINRLPEEPALEAVTALKNIFFREYK